MYILAYNVSRAHLSDTRSSYSWVTKQNPSSSKKYVVAKLQAPLKLAIPSGQYLRLQEQDRSADDGGRERGKSHSEFVHFPEGEGEGGTLWGAVLGVHYTDWGMGICEIFLFVKYFAFLAEYINEANSKIMM